MQRVIFYSGGLLDIISPEAIGIARLLMVVPTIFGRVVASGVTEQCGALSQSRGSGLLCFANQIYRLSPKLPLTAYTFYKQFLNNIN